MPKYIHFTETAENQAKKAIAEINRKAKERGLQPRFITGWEWVGLLGQEAFKTLHSIYPSNVEEVFEVDDYDFSHFLTGEKIEIKSSHGNLSWSPNLSVAINHDQYHQKPYDILVYAYYESPAKKMTICGWNTMQEFENHHSKKFYKEGEKALTQWGAEMFTVSGKAGCYIWSGQILKPMEKLLDRVQI